MCYNYNGDKNMKKIVLENNTYTLERDYKNGFNIDELKRLYTEYFIDYDYIFGDYSADKLRLKGFYNSNNKKVTSINNIKDLDDYIKNYCNYECKHFLIKKIK